MDYVFLTYKRPKIAIAYFDETTMVAILDSMQKKKVSKL